MVSKLIDLSSWNDKANQCFNRGFAVGWDYALSWLIVLPFELTAASITIRYWNSTLNVGIFIAIFLVALCAVQVFGVRGYGEGKTTPSPTLYNVTVILTTAYS